ncbi:MAG: ABC transporter ATP-binding protein [Deltaproteobacteria bacterium]|nr:ABC transporter ATP-binding protein [Deltaproteobacteria bacterium]
MLNVEKVEKSFLPRRVLREVSLSVDSEIRVIIGLNGGGKSTLLKIIAGIWPADSGKVFIDGKNVTGLSPEDREIGYVPQHPALFRHLSVKENICYALKNGRGAVEEGDRLIALLGLRDILDKKPDVLSGGYQSRVSLARALASRPKVMLFDEPLSDLDLAIKEKLLPEFKRVLKAQGMPVLYVTHDPREAGLVGDSFSALVQGEISEINSAEEAFDLIKADYDSA